jgi:exo-beta-1,3-glucanase (GH17 family)
MDLFGVCYDAMHNSEYPLKPGQQLGNLAAAMDIDFQQMASLGIKHVRTYYSNFYGVPVAPAAAKHGIKLHLGVFMTNEAWYQDQVNAAVDAVRSYPDTIAAILVGNENMQPAPGAPYTADDIINRMQQLRDTIRSASPDKAVPVGTVQRITEWIEQVEPAGRLAHASDIIGVNIYTFFGYHTPEAPTKPLDDQWQLMVNRYGRDKLLLTETGFPSSGGSSPSGVPATLDGAKGYYQALVTDWLRSGATGGRPLFYFAMYDRRPDDDSLGTGFEQHFGLLTWDRQDKGIIGTAVS